jgi:release factor glutamine methyltransferase
MRLKELQQWGIQKLKTANIETARLDAEVLLAHILHKDRFQLYLDTDEAINGDIESQYKALIGKRASRVPVSYLTGHKEFMSLDFIINENVLIPRPETEILVETVCKMGKPESLVLDVGTGSGAIGISLAKYNKDWQILATDVSFEALMVAKTNAGINGVIDRIKFFQMNLFDALSTGCNFDWIVSNPPYISTEELPRLSAEVSEYEPKLALDGGPDGLEIIRKILLEAYKLLKPDGKLAIEMGYGQSEIIQIIAHEIGKYSDFSIIKDYSGIPRVFYCQINQE